MALVQTSVKIEPWHLEASKTANLNLSHLLRTAIEAVINTGDDIEKEEAEIQRQKAIIAAKEEILNLRKSRKTEFDRDLELLAYRNQYLQEHSGIIEEHQMGRISSKGYVILQNELKFVNKHQLVEYLNNLNGNGFRNKIESEATTRTDVNKSTTPLALRRIDEK